MRNATLVVLTIALLAGCATVATGGETAPAAARLLAANGDGEKTFADLPWGSALPEIRSLLGRQGFSFVETDEDGDHVFNGGLLGHPTRIYAFMGAEGLVKLQIVIITPDEDALTAFADMREILVEKYGPPEHEQESFEAPYSAGDGRAEEAIEAGKGTLLLAYDGLWMEVTEHLVVSLSYESSAWPAEHDRRAKAQARSLF